MPNCALQAPSARPQKASQQACAWSKRDCHAPGFVQGCLTAGLPMGQAKGLLFHFFILKLLYGAELCSALSLCNTTGNCQGECTMQKQLPTLLALCKDAEVLAWSERSAWALCNTAETSQGSCMVQN